MLKLNLRYFGHLMQRADSLKKTLWKRLKAEGEDGDGEMVGWYHRFNGHELGQTLGDGEGQANLACFGPWGSQSQTRLGAEQQ